MTAEPSVNKNNKSIVTKLKPWKEFFDEDEFKKGLDAMKKSNSYQKENEASSSDSEPSVDNFNCQELN